MANPVVMPKFGQMTEESTVVRWLKNEGEHVAKGEILLEIETDKATMEVESFYEGTLLKVIVPEGTAVPVMTTLAFIGEAGESLPLDSGGGPSGSTFLPGADAQRAAEARPEAAGVAASAAVFEPGTDRMKISPRAAGLMLAHGIDGRAIRGTGPGGRIVEKDVLSYLNSNAVTAVSAPISATETPRATAKTAEPLSTMRRVIAERLTESYRTAPHFFVTVPVDMAAIEEARRRAKGLSVRVSITDFLVKSLAEGLRRFPAFNSTTDGKTVTLRDEVHIGVAVALKEGLVAPIVRNADRLTLLEISSAMKELIDKARSRRLKPEEMTGGTFTLSNLGVLNVDSFTAIINPGESAILAVSTATPKPVVINGEIVIRPMMNMTLSADHRLIDGALAARFLNAVKDRLEDAVAWEKELRTED